MTIYQKIFAVLCFLAAVCLVVIAPSIARAADKQCVVASVAEFLENVKNAVDEIYEIPKDQMDVFVTNLNAGRVKANLHPIEADSMLLGTLKGGKIGLALFKDGCLVPGMAISASAEFMHKFLKDLKSEAILNVTAPSA